MKTVVLSGEPKSTQHIYGLVCSGRFPRRYMTDQGFSFFWSFFGIFTPGCWLGCTPAFISDFSGAFELWSTLSFGFDIELFLLPVPG